MRAEAIYVAPDGKTAADDRRFSWLAAIAPPAWAIWRGHYGTALAVVIAIWLARYGAHALWGHSLIVEAAVGLGEAAFHGAAGLLAWRWHRLLLGRAGYAVMAVHAMPRREAP